MPAPALSVLPECWYAVQVFLAMGTQWTWSPGQQPQRQGLQLTSLPIVMAAKRHVLHRKPLHELLPQLQVMEDAALAVWNES